MPSRMCLKPVFPNLRLLCEAPPWAFKDIPRPSKGLPSCPKGLPRLYKGAQGRSRTCQVRPKTPTWLPEPLQQFPSACHMCSRGFPKCAWLPSHSKGFQTPSKALQEPSKTAQGSTTVSRHVPKGFQGLASPTASGGAPRAGRSQPPSIGVAMLCTGRVEFPRGRSFMQAGPTTRDLAAKQGFSHFQPGIGRFRAITNPDPIRGAPGSSTSPTACASA